MFSSSEVVFAQGAMGFQADLLVDPLNIVPAPELTKDI